MCVAHTFCNFYTHDVTAKWQAKKSGIHKFPYSIVVKMMTHTSTLILFECCHEIVAIVLGHVSKWHTLASHARDFVICFLRKGYRRCCSTQRRVGGLRSHRHRHLTLNLFSNCQKRIFVIFWLWPLFVHCSTHTHVTFKCLLNLSFDFMRCFAA